MLIVSYSEKQSVLKPLKINAFRVILCMKNGFLGKIALFSEFQNHHQKPPKPLIYKDFKRFSQLFSDTQKTEWVGFEPT